MLIGTNKKESLIAPAAEVNLRHKSKIIVIVSL